MRAVRCYAPSDVRIDEIDEPSLGDGEVRIKTKWGGICGSDLHLYHSGPNLKTIPGKSEPQTNKSTPLTMGHEFSGEIVETGNGVSWLKTGDRVTAQPFLTCRECYWCRKNLSNVCPNISYLGFMTDGVFAEYAIVPAYTVHKLPSGLSYEKGAFVEPLAVAIRGVKRGGVGIGDSVVIIGAGAIGLLTIQAARAAGATKIFVVARGEHRRESARQLGATAVFDPSHHEIQKEVYELTNGIGADITLDCAGNASSSSHLLAVSLTRRAGKIVLLGVAQQPVELSLSDILLPEKDIISSSGHIPEDFRTAIDLLDSEIVDTDILTTNKIAFSDIVEKGFMSLEGEDKAKNIKILVSFD